MYGAGIQLKLSIGHDIVGTPNGDWDDGDARILGHFEGADLRILNLPVSALPPGALRKQKDTVPLLDQLHTPCYRLAPAVLLLPVDQDVSAR